MIYVKDKFNGNNGEVYEAEQFLKNQNINNKNKIFGFNVLANKDLEPYVEVPTKHGPEKAKHGDWILKRTADEDISYAVFRPHEFHRDYKEVKPETATND